MQKDGEEHRKERLPAECPSSLLAGLDETATTLVVQHLRRAVLPAGHVVFEDNAPGDTLYIIESGRVQVSKTLENGQEHVFAELGPGEFFGEMALLEEKPRSARVSTLTPTSLLAMPSDTFSTLIEHHPAVAVNFLKEISARLRQRNHIQEALLREKQALVDELAAKNVALEHALTELRAAMETVAEHERVTRDLEIARQIQRQMLPTVFPRVPGLELYATTVPSRWVGGDLYDAVGVAPQTLGLLLGDVSGKGIPAAMQMARLMGEFRASVSHRADPEGVMQVLNELLCQRNMQWTSFVTVQYVVLDMAQQQAHYICAGHPPIILCHADGQLEYIGAVSNVPLGIDETFSYRQECRQLSPGDRLLLYSDGAYELRDSQGVMLGLSRLAEIFAAAPPEPEMAIRTIQKTLKTFGDTQNPHDDTTFLCVRLVEP